MTQEPLVPRRVGWMLARPLIEPVRRFGRTLRRYDLPTFRRDAVAGLSVSVVAVPQAMAYALIAGVPPQYGLYTVIFQCLIGSIFNSHPLLSVGPINTQSLLVLSIVSRLVEADGNTYLAMVISLTFLKGVMQMGLAEMRLGNLVRYVSQSVVVGFTAGAGVLIAAKQISNFLGFAPPRAEEPWPGLIGVAQQLNGQFGQTSVYAVALGVLALAVMLGSRAISRLMPGPLIAVAVTALVVWGFGWGVDELTLVPPLPEGLPRPALPDFVLIKDHFDSLLAGAMALSLLGLMEAYSIGKSLSTKTGDSISANQELFSQGLTNLLTSFLSCIPGSGSFSRSALNYHAGGKTHLSGVFNAAFVLVIFLLFSPAAKYVPLACIAAILFVIAYGLIDWRYLLRVIKSSRADAAVCLGTFVATLFMPLAYAVFIGIALNFALYLRRASQLHINEMVRSAGGPFIEKPLKTRSTQRDVVFLQLEGDLFFGVADELSDRFSELSASPVRVVILRLKRCHSIDATVLQVIEQFTKAMQARNGHVILCGVKEELMGKLAAFGLVRVIGEKNVFPTGFGVFASAKRALHRAKELVGSSVDLDQWDDESETEGWAYQI